jgi:pimeloyl-ACP methyl ester carboxylesterase
MADVLQHATQPGQRPFQLYGDLGHQIPALAEHYTVIAPGLRGYGYTEKPYTGYDKRTTAADIRKLMTALGYDRAAVIGHDRAHG